MNDIQPVILSGGSGTRLWPLSREAYPKQFLPLVDDTTMLQSTWKRVAPIDQRQHDTGETELVHASGIGAGAGDLIALHSASPGESVTKRREAA